VTSKKQAARKRTTTTTVEEPRTEDEEPLDAFERARAEFSGGPRVTLTIYRYDDGATAYLKRVGYEPEVVNEEWIRKKWGPGSYQLRFMDPENPSTRWSRVVEIAADVPSGTPSPAAPALGETFVLSMLQRQNEIMLQALVGSRGAAAAPAGGDAFGKLIEGMQAQNTELLKASLARPDMSSTILTVFEKGLQIAGEAKLESEGGWLAQLSRAARELIPALAEMSKMRAAGPVVYPGVVTATTPRAPALPAGKQNGGENPPSGFVSTAPAPSSPPPGPSAPSPNSATSPADEAVRQFAPQILEAARGGASPADVAEGILQAIPPMFYPELDTLTPEKVFSAEPGLEAHRAFVEELLAALKEPDDDNDGAGVPNL
jgi:hypothetical protein